MKRLSGLEQKEIQLEMLKYLDGICRENDISYSLCGGTLLGAVRHKGFIPWDDDIDIFLTRPEYERLMQILKKEKKYKLLSPDDNGYYHVFAKLVDNRTVMVMENPNEPEIPNLGVFVDIFPIDGLPDDYEEQKRFTLSTRKLMYNMRMAMPKSYYNSNTQLKKIIKKVIFWPRHIITRSISTPDQWKSKLLEAMQTYDFATSTYAGFILSTYGIKEILPKEVFAGRIELEFEGEKFLAFEGYELNFRTLKISVKP